MSSCVKDEPFNPGEVVIPDSPLRGLLTLNEINGNGADADKYIELYNNSNAAIDLEGITIGYHNAGTLEYAITWTGAAGRTIAPGAFVLLQGSKGTGDLSTGLSAQQGIFVQMLDSQGDLVDIFMVVEQALRPGDASTTAKSFARIPDGSGLWYFANPTGTPGTTNGTDHTGLTEIIQVQSPTIENIAISPATPTPANAVTVSATVLPVDGTLSSVKLDYYTSADATVQTLNMTNSGTTYSATIPAQVDLTFVYYTITATNSRQGVAAEAGNYFVANAPLVTTGQIYVNECDPQAKQWEFYNPGTSHINIGEWKLTKDNSLTAANNYIFPAGTIIPAGSYIVFTQNVSPGPTFGMSPSSGFKYDLFYPDPSTPGDYILVDTFDNFDANQINQSIPNGYTLGRVTDGNPLICTFSTKSMGASNSTGVVFATVVAAKLSRTPAAPAAGEAVLVTANLTQGSATSFELVYSVNGGPVSTVTMTRTGGTPVTYTGTIPAGAVAGDVVTYSFQVTGNAGSRSAVTATTTYTVL